MIRNIVTDMMSYVQTSWSAWQFIVSKGDRGNGSSKGTDMMSFRSYVATIIDLMLRAPDITSRS